MTEQNPLDSITVIIPTYNRVEVLRRTLAAYLAQSSAGRVRELLVVDDGSTDGTRLAVAEFQRAAPFSIRYFFQPNRGPAAARNRGIEEAAAPIVLLTDDDMIPHPELVARHFEWHQKHPESSAASLGLVEWSPELLLTAFMRWYGECGPFAYREIRQRNELDFRFFYSCNLSLKREFLQAFGKFDERFKVAAYEDTELGFRLGEAGLRLMHDPQAITYHYQYFTFAEACRRKRQAESARQLFFQTEAGKRLQELQHQRDSALSFRIGRRIATLLGSLFPVSKLLDSRFPLPGIIYRSLFWYHAGRIGDTRSSGATSPPGS